MKRCLLALWVLGALFVGGTGPDAVADPKEEEALAAERAVEALHPFGVRGLPNAFADCTRGSERRQAIEAGLAWLTAHQTPDGCWRPDQLGWHFGKNDEAKGAQDRGLDMYATGVTGMVVAAYLGAGYTHRGKHPNTHAVRRALIWLVKQQDAEGCVGPRRSQQYVYNHAFGTLALVEAYALTGDRKLQGPAQKALDFSARARNPDMVWRYGVKPGDNDTSVTGCMGMPMYVAGRLNKAGLRAGQIDPLSVDDSSFSGIRRWMDAMTDPDYGRAGYVMRGTGPARPQELVDKFPGEKSESCTAIAVLMRQLLPAPGATKKQEKASQQMIERGIKLMLELKPDWQPGQGSIDLYYWYYATMAMRQAGGEAWSLWDPALAGALLEGQCQHGTLADVRGSWPAEGVWAKMDGGRIYATAIALLTLQTPDRMRPLPEDRSDLLDALQQGVEEPVRLASILRGVGVLQVPKAADVVIPFITHENVLVAAAAAEALEHIDAGTAGVKALGGMLADPRVEVRRAVVRALAAQGAAIAPLVDALGARLADEDRAVAVGAARALGASGAAEAAALLEPRLEGGSVALRVAAAASLLAITKDQTKTMPVLIAGLSHKTDAVRTEAARALESQAPDIGSAEAALRDALKDESPQVVVHVAGALHRAGKEKDAAVAAWIAALEAPRAAVRLAALERIQASGDARAVTAVRAQLMDGPTTLRVACARVLQSMGEGARPAAAEISWCCDNGPMALRAAAAAAYDALAMDAAAAKTHLLDPFVVKDRRVVEGCVRSLVLIGKPVVPHILTKLAGGDVGTQAWMLDALRRIGPDADEAVSALAKIVELSPDAKTRWRAARVLTAIGPASAPALPALEMALQHEKAYVREAALEAVGALASESEKAVAILLTLASDRDKKNAKLRMTALRSLGGAGKQGDKAFPVLMAALDETNTKAREAGIDGMTALYPHVEKLLGKHADDDQVRVRDGIAEVVRRRGPEAKKMAKPLAKSMERRAPSGESRVANALASIGKPAVSALTKLLKSDKANVRGEAARALGMIGPDAKRALGTLKKLTRDPDWTVQDKARTAIARIQPPKRK